MTKNTTDNLRYHFGELVCGGVEGGGLASVNFIEKAIPEVRHPLSVGFRIILFGTFLFLPMDQEGHSPCYKLSEYFLGDSSAGSDEDL